MTDKTQLRPFGYSTINPVFYTVAHRWLHLLLSRAPVPSAAGHGVTGNRLIDLINRLIQLRSLDYSAQRHIRAAPMVAAREKVYPRGKVMKEQRT